MKKLIPLLLATALTLSLCVSTAWAGNVPAPLNELCTQEEWEVLKLTNRERLANGLVPYSIFPSLQTAAGVREKELNALYSHKRPNGSDCFTVLTEGSVGYNTAGENIAAGQTSPTTVLRAWMSSDGHRQNILDAKFTHLGIGYTNKSCTIITETGTGQIRNGWVQLFIGDNCSITSISLSQQSISCQPGSSLDDMDLHVEAVCSLHGTCYLPLLSGMCSGFDPNASGKQTVTVTYAGKTAQLLVNAPSGSGTGGGSGSSGGGSSTSLNTSSADSWAVNWLKRADSLKLLSQRNRTNFTADVTRLQFADLAVTLAEQLTGKSITPVAKDAFTDTTELVILKAKAAGIAGGYKNESTGTFEFRPEKSISREEICVMLAHVVEYVQAQMGPFSDWNQSEEVTTSFPDLAQVEGWAVKQVALMTNNGIMSGRATDTGALLTPKAQTELQEAITLAVKLYDKSK